LRATHAGMRVSCRHAHEVTPDGDLRLRGG
jgi:hypothetical protein